MERHVPAVHFRRQAAALACEACPRTFARKDAIKRHVLTRKAAHFSDERKAFLGEFNRIPAVVRMRAECPGDGESYVKLNDELYVVILSRFHFFVADHWCCAQGQDVRRPFPAVRELVLASFVRIRRRLSALPLSVFLS
jgi:hypothetical protein